MNHGRTKVVFTIGALTVGGTESQLIGILQHLDRDLFEPHLFTFYSHGELVSQVPQDVVRFCDQTDNAKEISRRSLPGSKHRRLAHSLRHYCQSNNIDVVYDRTYHVSLVTGAACRPINVPYINTVVSDPYTDFFPTAGPFGYIKFWKLQRIYSAASRVLCVSEGVRNATARFYRLPLDNLTTCHNFISARRATELDVAATKRTQNKLHLAEQLGTHQRPLRIVAIGRLHSQKNVSSLLLASKTLQDRYDIKFQLTIVGDGNQRDKLQATAVALGIDQQVQFVGTVENPADYLIDADVYCLPSLGEGMPNTMIEALWMGVPTIASDCDHGPSEISESGKWADLYPVDDNEALAEELMNFAKNPADLRRRAAGASESMRSRFSPSVGIERLESHLLQVVAR